MVRKALDTWGEIHTNKQSFHVSFGLDSYTELDFVSIDFIKSLGLKPCTYKCYNHKIPNIEAIGCSSLSTYSVFHLYGVITDK